MTGGRPVAFLAALDFESWAAERVMATLIEAGYDGVEWTMAHLDSLAQPAVALAAQQDLVTGGDHALALTLEAIERAHDAEIPVVNVLTGPNLWEPGATAREDEEAWALALAGLERAAERAAPLGVRVALEPCWGTLAHDARTARRALGAVAVDVCFDPSHFVMSGDDPVALAREWGPRIAHVHLKDAFGRPGAEGQEFHFCLLGDGKVPWAELLGALDEASYRGAVSVEFEAYRYYEQVLHGDPAAAARLAATQVAALTGVPR